MVIKQVHYFDVQQKMLQIMIIEIGCIFESIAKCPKCSCVSMKGCVCDILWWMEVIYSL